MKRRPAILALLALGALLTSRSTYAQEKRKWRIGRVLINSTDGHLWDAFTEGLRAAGFVENENYVYETRNAEGRFERLSGLSEELVRARVDLIVTASTPGVRAAKNATTSIPIIMTTVGDPVRAGLVTNLAQPGGNVTGMTNLVQDTEGKAFELAIAVLPGVKRLAQLRNPRNPSAAGTLVSEAARRAGIELVELTAGTTAEIDAAIANAARAHVQALLVKHDPFLISQRARLAQLALAHKLPLFAQAREHVTSGGLMSYGVDLRDQFRRAAAFAARILKGAKPADLPIEQATRVELVVNRRTAQALGLQLPQEILLRADEVIE